MKRFLFLFPFLFLSYLHADVQELSPITFGGGVDYKTDCSDIDDKRACDMNNMISDYLGTTSKRFGSKKSIDQAISSTSIKGLYRAYYSTGTTINKATIMISNGNIYTDTTTTVNGHIWKVKQTGLDKNQNYEFKQYGNYVLITGDSLNDKILKYDIQNDSVTTNYTSPTSPVLLTAKHQVFSNNYYILGNVKEITSGTTYYPSRIWYSILLDTPTHISSMTVYRWLDVSNDGEEITGLGEIGNVHIFKPSSISELSFSILDFTSLGGDQTLTKKVNGFGCIAPRTLVNNGKYYTFLSWDGIRIYDPTNRLTSTDETKVISTNVEPIIKRVLESGTYKNAHAVYYGKRNWYIFSFEDPLKYPHNRANSTLIYDFNTGEWFPFSNWLSECYTVFDNVDDKQEIVYGDSNDGYVYYIDQERNQNDSRKEVVIDNCDLTGKWTGVTSSTIQVVEGTASIKLSLLTPLFFSSATYMGTINLGEWYDKSNSTASDKISFKVYPSSLANLTSLRIDLELNTVSSFDAYYTSVTISSAALTGGTSQWSTIEIPLSSFTILDSWIDVSSGILPFANSPTFYGLRFFSTGIAWHELTIDDVRFVKDRETELNAFRLSKQFNLGTNADKRWRQMFIDCDQPATSKFYVDIFSNFGDFDSRETVENTFDKNIFVTGYEAHEGIFKLDGNDFTVLDSTRVYDSSVFAARPITADSNYVYIGDQYNNRIMKFERNDLTVLVASAGSVGSGDTNFNKPFQMAITESNGKSTLFICDFTNHAIKVYNAENMKFKKSFGTLGNGATSFFYPTGIAADNTDLFIFQDGNHRLQKWNVNDFSYKDSVLLNLNTVGNTRLATDQKYVYVFYSKISEDSLLYSELWLEQRNKSDLKLVTKTRILPDNTSVVSSTYCVMGDVGVNDDFVYLTFTDGLNIKRWEQTSAADWNSGTVGTYLDTTTVSGDVIFSPISMVSTISFYYTGAEQTWVVPIGITSISVLMCGAAGTIYGLEYQRGKGGQLFSTMAVTGGDTLYFYVGGIGTPTIVVGAFNGGGGGGDSNQAAMGGGGATDIRVGGNALANRVLVAGGAGGCGKDSAGTGRGGKGGDGAWTKGLDGDVGYTNDGIQGGGGTQSAGGTGANNNGTLGIGGNAVGDNSQDGGAGGGGYYGGGNGGMGDQTPGHGGAGGGGGSSYSGLGGNVIFTSGTNSGAGYIIIYSTNFTFFSNYKSTYTSKSFNTGQNISSFNTFTVNETLNNGTIQYRLFTDTDSTIDINNSITFIASETLTNESIPTIDVKQYLIISAKFERTISTYTPTLHNFTLNFDRSNLLQTYGEYKNQGINTLMDDTTLGDFTIANRNYYLQKRLKDGVNFPIIREYTSINYLFSVASNGLTYKPKRKTVVKDIGTESSYIQFKFSEDSLDNSFKLYKLSPILIQEKVRER